MRSLLLLILLVFSSFAIAADDNEIVESVDNGLNSISLGKLLQDFSKRKDIALLVDPRVNAKIHLLGIASEKIDFSELHTILNLHQFGMAEVEGMYVVAPMSTLKQRSLVLANDGDSSKHSASETVLTVVEIKHVPAAQMVPILRPLIPQQGSLSAYIPSNKLILNTSKHNTDRLLKIITRLDVKTDFNFGVNKKNKKQNE